MRKTIIFYVQLETQFFELVRVYQLLATTDCGTTNFKFLFKTLPMPVLERMTHFCNENEIPYDIEAIDPKHKRISVLQRVKRKLCTFCGGAGIFLQNLFYETAYFVSYFSAEQVSLIFVAEDGIGTSPALFSAAKKLHIHTVVIPYEYSHKKQAIESILSNGRPIIDFQVNDFKSRLIFFLARKWKTKYQEQVYLRIPRDICIAMVFFNFGPKRPWSVNGGYGTKLLCDSQHMQDFYHSEGLKKKKIRLTGNLGHDQMYHALKKVPQYWKAYDKASLIDKSKMAVLFAFPPDYTASRNSAFHKYEDFIDYWITLSQASPFVIPYYQVHPSVTEAQKSYIRSKGIFLEMDNIVQIIPKIDVLVTSVSSIIRLAIGLRKPVLNFDLYHFDYPDYLGVCGVKTTSDLQDFASEYARISTDLDYVQGLKQEMKAISNKWAILDGQVGKRVLSEVQEYT